MLPWRLAVPVVMGTTGSEVFACGTLGTSAGLTSTAGLVLTATPKTFWSPSSFSLISRLSAISCHISTRRSSHSWFSISSTSFFKVTYSCLIFSKAKFNSIILFSVRCRTICSSTVSTVSGAPSMLLFLFGVDARSNMEEY